MSLTFSLCVELLLQFALHFVLYSDFGHLFPTFLFFGFVGARLTFHCLSCWFHIGVIKLGPLFSFSLSLSLQTPLDQCCLYNFVFSTFACGAGFLQSVFMACFLCLLWVAFGLQRLCCPAFMPTFMNKLVFVFVTTPFRNSLRIQQNERRSRH